MTAKEIDKALLSELVRGAQETYHNAEALFEEAVILRRANKLSRSYFLHQISLEECAKIEVIGWYATSLLMGHETHLGKLGESLVQHRKKNYTNAYFMERSAEEDNAMAGRDFEAASKAFSDMQKTFHADANTAKNAALYVDWKDGKFVSPSESITTEMVDAIRTLNERFLAIHEPNVRILTRWEASPESIAATLDGLEGAFADLYSKYPDDPCECVMRYWKKCVGD